MFRVKYLDQIVKPKVLLSVLRFSVSGTKHREQLKRRRVFLFA